MTLILNGTDNSATTPAVTGTDTDTGVYYPAANQVAIATSGTQAMLANASQGVQFANAIGVGATTPTTSGVGITFPATANISSDANTLDDYEEGTFTAAFVAELSGTVTIDTLYRTASYTKVGRLVTVHAQLVVGSVSSPNGGLFITGLPFRVSSTGSGTQTRGSFPVAIAGISSGNAGNFIGQVINNEVQLYVYYNNGTTPEATAANKCQANAGVYFCATYVTST